MRSFFIAFIIALLGGGLGLWRAQQEWNQFGDVVGDKVDPEVIAKAIESSGVDGAVKASTGIVSPDAIPKVEVVGGNAFDFGTMLKGTERSHSFKLKNSGKAPLILEVLRSTCKCTIGTLEKSVLQPGEESAVKLTWKAEGVLEEFSQTATIGTNDERMREVQLSIVGKIGSTYLPVPNEMNFGEFSSRDSFEKPFKVFSFEDTPLVATAYWADLDQELITASCTTRKLASNEFPEYADARYVAEGSIKVLPGVPTGPLNGQIHIEIGQDQFPMSIRCSGTCVSDLRILAGANYSQKLNRLDLLQVSSVKGYTTKFHIAARNTDNKKIEIKLKDIRPAQAAEVLKVVVGDSLAKPNQTLFPVTLTIPKNVPQVNFAGGHDDNAIILTFESNIDTAKELPLRVLVTVTE
jgi:Protein of unknown function (DUF1573)